MSADAARVASLGSFLCGTTLLIHPRLGPPRGEELVFLAALSVCATWLGLRGMWRQRDPARFVALAGFTIGILSCIGLMLGHPHHSSRRRANPTLHASFPVAGDAMARPSQPTAGAVRANAGGESPLADPEAASPTNR